jgi:hypothetical protein
MREQLAWKAALEQHIKKNWFAWAMVIAAVITPIAAAPEGNLGKIVTWVPVIMLFAYTVFVFCIEYPKERQLRSTKHIPLVFQIDVERNEAMEALRQGRKAITEKTKFKDFSLLEERYNVQLDDLLFHTMGELDKEEERWEAFMMRAYWTTQTLSSHLPGQKTYHVMLPIRNVTALLGIGALFRTDWPMVLYQPFTDGYHSVIDLSNNTRSILGKPDEKARPYFNCEEQVKGIKSEEVAIAFDLAGHSPVQSVAKYLSQKKHAIRQVNLINTYEGNLKKEDQWFVVMQQLWQKLRALRAEGVTRFHLFPAMPAALIFGVGMVLGRDVPATVYQWFPESEEGYYPVYRLENLKRYL